MLLGKRERPIVVVNLVYITVFTLIALGGTNYEFVLYAGVIVAIAGLLVWKQASIRFGPGILWGLTIWGFLHMAGGNIRVGDGHRVLYGVELIRIVPRLHILRFDHVVHAFGFGVATLACHHLLRPYLKKDAAGWGALVFLIVLMSSGLGALNELVEFSAVLLVPETGVGGYDNTMCDLLFNLLGGLMAAAYLTRRRRRETG